MGVGRETAGEKAEGDDKAAPARTEEEVDVEDVLDVDVEIDVVVLRAGGLGGIATLARVGSECPGLERTDMLTGAWKGDLKERSSVDGGKKSTRMESKGREGGRNKGGLMVRLYCSDTRPRVLDVWCDVWYGLRSAVVGLEETQGRKTSVSATMEGRRKKERKASCGMDFAVAVLRSSVSFHFTSLDLRSTRQRQIRRRCRSCRSSRTRASVRRGDRG